MSRTPAALDRQAVEVLLSALEAPRPALSASALQSFPAQVGAQLIAAALIKPGGHEAVATSLADHDDSPVTLTWSAEHRGFGYFSPAAGWVGVSHADIDRYGVDLSGVMAALTAKMQLSPKAAPSVLVADHLWDIGKSRFGQRPHQTPIMFGRRLHDVGTWQAVRRTLGARPSQQRRVILTSTRPDRLPEPLAGNVLISVHDALGDGLALDPAIIAARLDRLPVADTSDPIVLIGDGKEVRLFGETFRFPKGVRQRQIIRHMHDRYRQGHRWTSTEEIVTTLELRPNARIRDFFKKSPAWNRLLTERSGMCGFCLEATDKL
ncbi:MAG: hypothetical protein K8H87_09625 [Pseudorhodoplanes sp.]|nr:hypothetical protein [Pseudorhodoplanes sp.]